MKTHTESKLFKKLKVAIPEADLIRHEDRMALGIPDVSYSYEVHGWIELKAYDTYPKSNILKFDNFTPMQKRFLKRKDQIAGHTYLLVWCAEDFLWFHGVDSYALGTLTRDQLITLATHHTQQLTNDIYPVLTQ